jgi:hypothetical protein
VGFQGWGAAPGFVGNLVLSVRPVTQPLPIDHVRCQVAAACGEIIVL